MCSYSWGSAGLHEWNELENHGINWFLSLSTHSLKIVLKLRVSQGNATIKKITTKIPQNIEKSLP